MTHSRLPIRVARASFLLSAGILVCSPAAVAVTSAARNGETSHGSPVAPILLALVFIGLAAALGGYAMRRIGQPAVLGELLVGMLVANLAYAFREPTLTILREGPVILAIVSHALLHAQSLSDAARQILPNTESSRRVIQVLAGPEGVAAVTVYQFVDQVSHIGVIFLLFLIGLETSIQEMKKVGLLAMAVAVVGVICPWALGAVVMDWVEPGAGFAAHLFIGGILTATSVAISARVFRDLKQTHTKESKIVLGAAVIDDVLGLIILAVADGLVVRGIVSAGFIAGITIRAVLFLLVSIGAGIWITPKLLRRLTRYGIKDLYLLFGLGLAFVFAWLANRVGLATIVGAFAAGLVIEDFFKAKIEEAHSLRAVLSPLESLIVPVYFVLMGMQVKFETFRSTTTLLITAGLTIAAIVGKLVSGAVCIGRHRWLAVGVAMMPRGEVGLIFASIGRSLGVVSDATFSAVVAMVMITTFVAPPLLKLTLRPERRTA